MSPLLFFKRMIARELPRYTLNVLVWLMFYTSPIALGLLTRMFFDSVSNQSEAGVNLWGVVVGFITIAAFRSASIVMGSWTDADYRFRITSRLRLNLMRVLISSPGEAVSGSPSETVNYFRDDVNQIDDTLTGLLDAICIFIFGMLSFFIMMRINPFITLWVMVPLMLVLLLVHLLSGRLQSLMSDSRDSTSALSGFLGDIMQIVQAIKISSAEKDIVSQYGLRLNSNRQVMLKHHLFNQAMRHASSNIVQIGTGFILLAASIGGADGRMTVGDLSLFVIYLSYAAEFIQFFGKITGDFKQAKVSIDRLQRLIGRPKMHGVVGRASLLNSPVMKRPEPLELLEVRGLTYKYPVGNKGIWDIGFTVAKGEIVVIAGKIGSGKSTLLKCILGLIPIQEGEVRWNSQVMIQSEAMVSPAVAYVAQSPAILSGTLEENIRFGLDDITEAEVQEAVQYAALNPDVSLLNHGLQSQVGSGGIMVSGGQKKRIAIARAILRCTDLLVLDDFSSGLDNATEEQIRQHLYADGKKGCIIATHNTNLLRNAHRVVVLSDGKVEAIGTPEDLMVRNETFRTLVQQPVSSIDNDC
ncbi:ABC transporter ATP-binding protein [Paenibacillus kobensis]|uniref:ABC transporter ATP-binding protein n=1 Tax=Paenibacillus kobensis TaxID=59841 RepID=UPI000FD9D404|nr:ABC transporter ATP-binding protein [Paenibacillus kobensis]